MSNPRTLRSAGGLLFLLITLPLVTGARSCERVDVGDANGGGAAGEAASGGSAGVGGGVAQGDCRKRHKVGASFPASDDCNTCTCQADGSTACTEKACIDGCGGIAGVACPDGQYCNYPPDAQCGAADQTGVCAVIQDRCTEQYQPVCGCDDQTHSNACYAAAAGVSVLHEGECGGGGGNGACGVRGSDPCPEGQYCNFSPEAQCGAADHPGTCAPIGPGICTLQYDPVCGCDGMTYGNACEATAAGMSIAHEGECDAGGGGSGTTCGGIASLECSDPNEFCNYEVRAGGQGCDGTISDAGGVCATRPDACDARYAPVCGCDRRTYGNACEAHSKSMSVLHDGSCTEIDCAAIGGHAVDGTGPAAECPRGETEHGSIVYSNGQIAIEGTICCIP